MSHTRASPLPIFLLSVLFPLRTYTPRSVCFAVTFAFVDLANHLWGQCRPESKPLVESVTQVYLISIISVLMGGIFGVVFGLVDVGHGVTDALSLQRELAMEERFCYPLGAGLGAIGYVAFGGRERGYDEER